MKKFITLITMVLSIAMTVELTSYSTQTAHASTLKRTYFPKSLRGNWHYGKYKLKITANTVTGTNFGNRKHTKIYKGSYYLNSHVRQTNKKILLWKQYGYYYFSLLIL